MYSGTTFNTKSGRVMGVHQKIDRVARRHVVKHLPKEVQFPTIQSILRFEGKNGPDGLKRKSPGVDEPWHFIDPQQVDNALIISDITNHLHNLSVALRESNDERASFEAAWLAHAITDGLTPAHHIPYEAALAELRDGEHHMTRDSRRKKVIMPGGTAKDLIRNNWKYWGSRGLMNMHIQFELGVATSVSAMRFDTLSFSEAWLSCKSADQLIDQFLQSLEYIDSLDMYDRFADKGWTTSLARDTKNVLVPEIIRMVMCAWRTAAIEAQR